MVKVSFTQNLARHIELESIDVKPGTLAAVFEAVFTQYPALKPYLFDEQNQLRQHVMLALDQQLLQGDITPHLTQKDFTRVHVMQALSGG